MTLFARDKSDLMPDSVYREPVITPNFFAKYTDPPPPPPVVLKSDFLKVLKFSDELDARSLERRAINAGLRACLREALGIIRQQNPNHPLLDKKNRQKLFDHYERIEMEKIKQAKLSNNDPNNSRVIPALLAKKEVPNEHIVE